MSLLARMFGHAVVFLHAEIFSGSHRYTRSNFYQSPIGEFRRYGTGDKDIVQTAHRFRCARLVNTVGELCMS